MSSRRYPLVHIVLAVFSLVLGFILGFILEPMWFARMGAMVVLFGAMSEYALLKQEFGALYRQLAQQDTNAHQPPSKWHQYKAYISHLLVVVGTLVWGFGDLIFI